MSSNINPNNIDTTYPVAGQDNDSQGFRDNFTNIKNNFTEAYDELTDLQTKVVLKSALTGGSLDNNFNGAVIKAGKIQDFRETINALGTVTGSQTLNYASGHYHTLTTSGSVTLAFSNLPATTNHARIRVAITVASTAHTLTLPAAVTLGISGIQGISSNIITFAATGTYIFEFTTSDGGTTIHIFDLSRPRSAFTNAITGTSATFSSSVLSTGTGGIGYSTGAGGTITQITSRTTGVTINKIAGAITLVSAAGATVAASFTVTNSTVAATDTIIVCQKSGTDKYYTSVTAVGAGSFQITFNTTGGTTTESPVFNFAVIKSIAA